MLLAEQSNWLSFPIMVHPENTTKSQSRHSILKKRNSQAFERVGRLMLNCSSFHSNFCQWLPTVFFLIFPMSSEQTKGHMEPWGLEEGVKQCLDWFFKKNLKAKKGKSDWLDGTTNISTLMILSTDLYHTQGCLFSHRFNLHLLIFFIFDCFIREAVSFGQEG